MRITFKCGDTTVEYVPEDDVAVFELLGKCDSTLCDGSYLVGSDMLFTLYLRVGGDIAKGCPLDVEVVLFYDWLDEMLMSVNMTEEPVLVYDLIENE